MKACLYKGWVNHTRLTPFKHNFTYPLFMVMLDLEEIPNCFSGLPGWSTKPFRPVQFRREDYYGQTNVSLYDSIKQLVKVRTNKNINGPIKLLTHLRYFGHCFNPISVYYCYNENEKDIEAVVAEVSNTPWNEKFCYVLPIENIKEDLEIQKEFHVSPFLPLDLTYRFQIAEPNDELALNIYVENNKQTVLIAKMNMTQKKLTRTSSLKTLVRFPLMTLQIITKIYWQALKLKLKGATIYNHH